MLVSSSSTSGVGGVLGGDEREANIKMVGLGRRRRVAPHRLEDRGGSDDNSIDKKDRKTLSPKADSGGALLVGMA